MRGNWSRRRFLVATGGVTGAALLAACAPTPAPGVSEPGVEAVETVEPSEKVGEAPITIQFWAPGMLPAEKYDSQWEPGVKVTKDADGKELREAWPWVRVYQMEQTFPNVTVQVQTMGWGEYWEKFDVAYAANVLPDIVGMTADQMPKYVRGGGLLDLREVAESLGLALEDYYEASREAFTSTDNKLYGWPIATYGCGVAVNLTLAKKLGIEHMLPTAPEYAWESFDQMLEFGKATAEYQRDDGRPMYGQFWLGGGGAKSQWVYTGWAVWGFGSDWLCDRGRADEVCLDNEAGIACWEWIADTIFKHKIAPEGMATATGEALNDAWFRGQLSLYASGWSGMVGSWTDDNIRALREAGEDVDDIEVQLSTPPAVEGAQPAHVGDPMGFSLINTGDAPRQRWAAEFLKILVSGDATDDGAPWYVSAHIPTAHEQAEGKPQARYEVDYLIPISRPRGAHPKYTEIADLWQQEAQAIYAGTKSAREAITAFAEAARIALREA